MNFLTPITFKVPEAPNSQYYQQERNLYLALQVPLDLDSGLVGLEGDYTASWSKHLEINQHINKFNDDMPQESVASGEDGNTRLEIIPLIQNITLLHFDSKSSIAFSDRLIEYLLLNVINNTETLDGNISYNQNLLGKISSPNDPPFYSVDGAWDDRMRTRLYEYTQTKGLNNKYRDLDGYLNKDLENYLLLKGDK
jgi:hypothetical protein